jgi:hypothetical protein
VVPRAFPDEDVAPTGEGSSRVVDELVSAGISGGVSYEAVVAVIAERHGCELVTLDARARSAYERMGVAGRYLG